MLSPAKCKLNNNETHDMKSLCAPSPNAMQNTNANYLSD